MELPNESTSLVVIFVLFCFVFIQDESVTSSFNQKYQKSFYSYDKNKLFSYDIIRGIQQATSISFFFPFWGINADQSTGVFLLARGSHHNVEIAEKLGKRVNKSKNFNPRTSMTTISSVNTDIGVEFCSVALEPSTSRTAARRPTT